MRNVVGQAVVGDDLYGGEYELSRLREHLEQVEHILMLAPRRAGYLRPYLASRGIRQELWSGEIQGIN